MSTSIDILKIRRRLGRDIWMPPTEFGPDGWRMVTRHGYESCIVTAANHDGVEYVHASIANAHQMPLYEDLVELHYAVWGDNGYAYQVFAPRAAHVNIHEHALHLWGRLDGAPVLPEFGMMLGGRLSI